MNDEEIEEDLAAAEDLSSTLCDDMSTSEPHGLLAEVSDLGTVIVLGHNASVFNEESAYSTQSLLAERGIASMPVPMLSLEDIAPSHTMSDEQVESINREAINCITQAVKEGNAEIIDVIVSNYVKSIPISDRCGFISDDPKELEAKLGFAPEFIDEDNQDCIEGDDEESDDEE